MLHDEKLECKLIYFIEGTRYIYCRERIERVKSQRCIDYTVHMYTYTHIYRYTRVQTDRGESNRDDTVSSFEMSKLMAVNKISIRLNDQTENSIEEDCELPERLCDRADNCIYRNEYIFSRIWKFAKVKAYIT